MLFDEDTFEEDCQQAYYKALAEGKRRVNNKDLTCFITVEEYLNYTYDLRTDYLSGASRDRMRYNSILSYWQERFENDIDYYREEKREAADRESERNKREAEAKRQAEAEARLKKLLEEQKKAEEAKRKAEEARRQAEAEAKRKAEEAKRQAEEEAKRKAEAAKRKKQNTENAKELERIAAEWKAKRNQQTTSAPNIVDTIPCPSCGNQINKTSLFCSKCGTQIQRKCPGCGGIVKLNNKFCHLCGMKLI